MIIYFIFVMNNIEKGREYENFTSKYQQLF